MPPHSDLPESPLTIIGVAEDIKHKQLSSAPDLQGYMPYRQGGWNSMAIVVRTVGDPRQARRTVMAALKQGDPLLPAYRVMTMDASIEQS